MRTTKIEILEFPAALPLSQPVWHEKEIAVAKILSQMAEVEGSSSVIFCGYLQGFPTRRENFYIIKVLETRLYGIRAREFSVYAHSAAEPDRVWSIEGADDVEEAYITVMTRILDYHRVKEGNERPS